MLITAIQVRRFDYTGTKMQGTATITLDNMIAVHDIKILRNGDSRFLAMPSRSTKSNTFKDVVHPINSDVRQALERLVFGAYDEAAKIECSHLELLLREDRKNVDFYSQAINDFEVGRITNHTSSSQRRSDYIPEKRDQQKKQPSEQVDDDLLKWLEG